MGTRVKESGISTATSLTGYVIQTPRNSTHSCALFHVQICLPRLHHNQRTKIQGTLSVKLFIRANSAPFLYKLQRYCRNRDFKIHNLEQRPAQLCSCRTVPGDRRALELARPGMTRAVCSVAGLPCRPGPFQRSRSALQIGTRLPPHPSPDLTCRAGSRGTGGRRGAQPQPEVQRRPKHARAQQDQPVSHWPPRRLHLAPPPRAGLARVPAESDAAG